MNRMKPLPIYTCEHCDLPESSSVYARERQYLNQYKANDEKTKDITKRLIINSFVF